MLIGFLLRILPLASFRIQLDEPDVAEVGAVGEPERSVRGIAEHARIDRVAVLDAIRPDHRTSVRPFVGRRLRVECRANQQSDCGLRLRAGRRVVDEVLVAGFDDVRRPRVVASPGDHFRSRTTAGKRFHQGARTSPRPSIIGDGDWQTGASCVGVELAIFHDNGRGIVHAGLAIERRHRCNEQEHCRDHDRVFHVENIHHRRVCSNESTMTITATQEILSRH